MLPHELPAENQELYQRHLAFTRLVRDVVNERVVAVTARLLETGWRAGILSEAPPLLTYSPRFTSLMGRCLQDPANGLDLRVDVWLTTLRTVSGTELHSVRLRVTRELNQLVTTTPTGLVMDSLSPTEQLQKVCDTLNGFDPEELRDRLDNLVSP